MQSQGNYLQPAPLSDGMSYTTDMSKRAKALAVWAALKQVGSFGVGELINVQCNHVHYFGQMLT